MSFNFFLVLILNVVPSCYFFRLLLCIVPLHCWCCCWCYLQFIELLVLLVYCVVSVIGLLCCQCCQFVSLLVLLLICHIVDAICHSQVNYMNHSLFCCYCCSFMLLYNVVGCYSCCICFGEILSPWPSPSRWLVGGLSHYYTPFVTKYPPSPFTPFIVGVVVGLSCCQRSYYFVMLNMPW